MSSEPPTDPSRPGESSGRILLVEDDPHTVVTVSKRLQRHGYEVHVAGDGQEGLEAALELKPDVILSDWMMPRMDGVTMCREIRAASELEGVYIIMISNKADAQERIKGFDEGADDYLLKSCDGEELCARIRAGMRIRRLQRELQLRAQTDGLTDLFNRTYLFDRLEHELRRAARYHEPITACMVDLDDFKDINDGLGHVAGDAALRHVANILKRNCRDTDIVARFGGDEFAILFTNTNEASAQAVIDRIISDLATETLTYRDQPVSIGLSFGLHEANLEAVPQPDDFIAAADARLYEMKRGQVIQES